MKTIKCIALILFASLAFNSNTYAKSLKRTIWANVVEVEKDGVSGKVITTLYLGKKHKVEVYKSIQHNEKLEETPYLYARGKYRCKGNTKKNLKINFKLENLMKEKIVYSGLVFNNGMVLIMPDESVQAYAYVSELLFLTNNM